ncbi:MAG: ammonium transporter [Chloroflexota bacterium]
MLPQYHVSKRLWRVALSAILMAVAFSVTSTVFAQEGFTNEEIAFAIDNLTMFIAAVLVLFMQAGFALVESGFNSGKNTINILFKNIMDMGVGAILYFLIGYQIMYPGDFNGFIGFGGVGIPGQDALDAGYFPHYQTDFLFQVAFAATAATIVSGAVAGRMQFRSYLVYSAALTGLIYPIAGSWQWGGGFLSAMGFHDFAGSLIVHAVGGFAGLAGAMILGPRIGRFNKDGTSNGLPGHNITAATLGVFILLIGWFGFNPGSVLAMTGEANTIAVVTVAVNTFLAACAGAVVATAISTFMSSGKPDIGYALNGMLAGLVGITANADIVSNFSALFIGGIAGALVVGGMVFLEKVKIDDPVGAWPVHGLCGIWGGIAAALFGPANLGVQLIGSVVYCAWAFVTMGLVFYALKAAGILRVSEKEELEGLDLSEHGAVNYPEFGTTIATSGD